MKCPKYITEALNKRATCAINFSIHDSTISRFLDKHGIEVEDFDIRGGCESYINPVDSSNRILRAILVKEE